LLEVFLFFTNHTPHTFLIGWDNVMPEFNIWLNLQRSLFGVWQDYRGLGVLDGMAQTANLFHTIYIFLLSLVLPQELLRYVFIMLTHLLGGIGFFVLACYLFKGETNKIGNKALCLAGSLFYMFNLGVIQMYFAPLEVFAVHFAALPWLALFITKALKKPTPRNYLILFLASLLTSPQGFVPTVFLVFLILLGMLCLFHVIKTGQVKVGLTVMLISILANAFWLLPYSYSAIKTQSEIRNTRINQFSSEEIFYRNKAHGDLKSVLTLKGFMLNSVEYDQFQNKDIIFMNQWYKHYNSLPYQLLFFILLIVTLIGFVRAFVKSQLTLLPYALSMLVAFIFLVNNTIILEQINGLLRGAIPILGEALRFPFTKFIILFALCFSLFLTYGLLLIAKWVKIKGSGMFLAGAAYLVIFYLAFPVFQGNFISPLLRIKIPSYYNQAFSYFSSKNDNGRIAVFPVNTMWNWQYRNWGNRGSGFFWYAVPQPITERAFDPWSLYNEQFFNEISNAVNTQNNNLLGDVTAKYNIKYILVDTTILNSITRSPINYDSLQRFIEEADVISKKNIFGKLIAYELKNNTTPVFAINNPTRISPSSNHQKDDLIYENLGNYVLDEETASVSYLMPSFFTGKLQEDLEFEVKEDKETIAITPKKTFPSFSGKNAVLEIPSLFSNEFLIPVELRTSGGKVSISVLYPAIYLNGKKMEVKEKPFEITTSFEKVSHVTFGDIDYSVPFENGVVRSYILNNYPNNIRFGDGTRGESILIDTRNIIVSPFLIPIKEEKIGKVKIVVNKIKGPFGFDNMLSQNYDLKRNVGGFDLYPDKVIANAKRAKSNAVLEAQGNSSAELSFYRDNLFHQASYILFAESKYKSGLPVNFYIDNTFQNRPEVETKLSKDNKENVIVIPKTEEVFQGYGFHFVVKSVGVEKAEANITRVALYPFPENTIRNIRILQDISPESIAKNTSETPIEFNKIVPSLYTAETPKQGSALVLSQAYDKGWKAYQINGKSNFIKLTLPFIFGKEIKNHVLVNNWANGWQIGQSSMVNGQSSIVILYLPQYLEYFGLSLTTGALVFLLLRLTQNINFGKLRISKNSPPDAGQTALMNH